MLSDFFLRMIKCVLFYTELAANEIRQAVWDFAVARHGRGAFGGWIDKNVMSTAMTLEVAAGLMKFTNKLTTLQTSTPISFDSMAKGAASSAASSMTN